MVVACLPYPAMASPTGSVRVPVPWVVRGLWSRREESTRRSPSTSSPDGGGARLNRKREGPPQGEPSLEARRATSPVRPQRRHSAAGATHCPAGSR